MMIFNQTDNIVEFTKFFHENYVNHPTIYNLEDCERGDIFQCSNSTAFEENAYFVVDSITTENGIPDGVYGNYISINEDGAIKKLESRLFFFYNEQKIKTFSIYLDKNVAKRIKVKTLSPKTIVVVFVSTLLLLSIFSNKTLQK